MTPHVRLYTPADASAWDDFVSRSWNGTFLHTRRFLSYHGDRFEDASLIVEDERQRIAGVLAAAIDPGLPGRVVSHPGITYGGMLHAGALRGKPMHAALQAVCATYRERGLTSFRYKAVPTILHRTLTSEDLLALFWMGAARPRCDLSSVIDLANRPSVGKGRRSCLKKARGSGMVLRSGAEVLPAFWDVLEENLRSRHGTRPTHSLAEIQDLHSRFPEQIECVVAQLDGATVAGVVLFHFHTATHTQYIASNLTGRDLSALDLLIEHSISESRERGRRYFSFGISMEPDGSLNEGLYQFKGEFGAGSVVHEFFDVVL